MTDSNPNAFSRNSKKRLVELTSPPLIQPGLYMSFLPRLAGGRRIKKTKVMQAFPIHLPSLNKWSLSLRTSFRGCPFGWEDQQVNQPTSKPVNKQTSQQVNHPTSKPVNKSTSQQVNQSASQPVNKSTCQQVNEPISPPDHK